jgi:branched-chain amino acid transport system permease protein
MPVGDPFAYRDKRNDWLEVFRQQRATALRTLVTPALVEEHRAHPCGPHSADLQLVLNFVRGPAVPMAGKAFAHMRGPGDHTVGLMTVRGVPSRLFDDRRYATEDEAQHGAFPHRLAAYGLYSPA